MINILLVEDDKSFGYVLSEYMQLKKINVKWAKTEKEAFEMLKSSPFDLAILDINLKQASGYDIAKVIREEYKSMPFIFLTARDLKVDQLKGYQLGAEEYVTKPIDEEILLAKIDAIITRRNQTKQSASEKLTWKDISLHKNKRELTVRETIFQLTERECLLMVALLSQPETLVERNVILQNLWESQDEFSRNSMDVYISRLRKYLSESEITIRNVHGKGFVLE
ncbi:MAG: response regulator transcription factor [Flavobacteriaceae bacterium]|nr:response regulator transcription factor [Flavobacteriaceae bacterium]